MFGRIKISTEKSIKLAVILDGVLSFLKSSEDSIYADYSVQECQKKLQKTVDRIAKDKRIRLSNLKFMFSPASALQDISLENNWADEYLELAKRFDQLSLKA